MLTSRTAVLLARIARFFSVGLGEEYPVTKSFVHLLLTPKMCHVTKP